MAKIVRNRVIRPSSRLETSISYKIDCKKVTSADTLEINITHESEDVHYTYEIDGGLVATKNSLHFTAEKIGGRWQISWSGAVVPRLRG